MKSSLKNQAITAIVILIIGVAIGGFLTRGKSADFLVESGSEKAKDIAGQIKNSAGKNLFNQDIDSDRDGLADWEEAIYKTDPKNPDTDNDGFLDGEEVSAGYDPNGSVSTDKLIDIPKDSEINLSTQNGRGAVEKYLLNVQTPALLKNPNIYQEAITEALEGKTAKLNEIISELQKSEQKLKSIAAPKEAVEIHKLTVGLMPEIIEIFESLKQIKDNPSNLIASLQKASSLKSTIDVLDQKIKNLAEKYQIITPE